MHVTWDPEDESGPQTFEFDPEDMLRSEAILVEKHFAATTDQWIDALRTGSMKARTVLLWLLLRRDHKNLRFEDTPDFRKRQMVVEMSSAELRAFYEKVSKTKMDEATRDAFQAAYDRDLADAIQRETGIYEGEVSDEGVALPKPA